MRFTFSKEQEEFRQEVRDFVDAELKAGTFTKESRSLVGNSSREFSNKMAKKGWIGFSWPKDWGLGRFVEIGLGGIFWVNDKQYNYACLEMFLLPNQMIPEHWHIGDEPNGVKVKMESWHVRWGKTYTYGEGEPTPALSVKVPQSQAKYVTALRETPLEVGEVAGLKKPLEKHWQQAGPEGCILTEPSNFHRDDLMRYTNPTIKV